MNCVLDAFEAHLEAVGGTTQRSDRQLFNRIRWVLELGQCRPLHVSVVPFAVSQLAKRHGLTTVVQHSILTPAQICYTGERSWWLARLIGKLSDWGEHTEPVTLQPAIYGIWGMNHAIFHVEVPDFGVPLIAVQLRNHLEVQQC